MAISMAKVSGTLLSAASVAANTTTWGTALQALATEWFEHIIVQVSVTFDASATGDAVIHRRKSTDDGTTDTDTGTAILTVDCAAGATKVVEFELAGGDYIEIGVENQDATYALTATIQYKATKVTGLG